jgi:HEAT repeat protein
MADGIPDILNKVRGTEPTPDEVRAAAGRIADLGEAAVPALLEALAEEDEAVLAVVAASLRRLATPAVTRRLVVLLRSPRLGDLAKALVLGVLEDGGMDIHDPALVGAGADLESLLFGSPAAAAGGAGDPGAADGGGNGHGAAEGPR